VLLEHENIAKVSLVDVDLVEEAVEGCSLSEILDSLPGLEHRYILALTRQLLEGLRFMHASGHVHGCLDPNNIIIEAETGTVKMCHRCCSAACPEDVPANNPSTDDGGFSDVASTPYMAPEVVRDDETVSAVSC
jgi:serine/threonine protein kinase